MSQRDAEDAFRLLERELGFLLRRARTLQARTAAQLHPDLEPASLGLLALLQDEGPLRASDLVVRLGLDKSTVSRQVNGLVDLGLVDREPDPDDGRAQVLRPTATGADRLAGIRAGRRSYLRSELADWPAEDIAALGHLLERYNRTMGRALAEGRSPGGRSADHNAADDKAADDKAADDKAAEAVEDAAPAS